MTVKMNAVVDLVGRQQISPDTVDWEPMLVEGCMLEGISMYPLADTAEGWKSYWMKLNPGVSSIMHRHGSTEMVAVVRGSVQDCDGVVFNAPDVILYPAGSTHVLDSTEGCTLLVVESLPSSVV
ncbi:hypothetical protein D9M69_552670 [compost metagenome]